MSNPLDDPARVPTEAELDAAVIPRSRPSTPADVKPAAAPAPAPSFVLSPDAERFLRLAAAGRGDGLESMWRMLGVSSGSAKKRILDELRGAGFIRLEAKGRRKSVYVYRAGYEQLKMTPPRGAGIGGAAHCRIVAALAKKFKARGCEVHIEQVIGPARKRADLLVLGTQRVAVEVGLTDVNQEVKNLVADLESGAVDAALFVTLDPKFLRKVQAKFREQPVSITEGSRVSWYVWPETDEE